MKRCATVGLVAFVAAVGTLVSATFAAEEPAPEGRRQVSSTVRATAQGGRADTEAVSGAPPLPEVSLETRAARGRTDAPASPAGGLRVATRGAAASLRLLSVAEGEATVQVDGRPEHVRPGSRLGDGTVKAVGPGRLVYVRPAAPGEPGDEALVVVTFDQEGRAHPRVFWTRDPEAPPTEVKRP
jgi:hypothetical protein